MEYYEWVGSDATIYLGLPAFAYDCFLNISGQKIGLMTERDMFSMCERGVRGGVTFIAKREEKVNKI